MSNQMNHEIDRLERIVKTVTTEWGRQKGLFPQVSTDGWMDLALSELQAVTSAVKEGATVQSEPDYGDGCEKDGFPGGCERMGCCTEPSPREEVVVVGYTFNLHSGVYSQYPGEDWSPMMMVSQHERIMAALGRPVQLPERKQKGWQCEQGIYPADGWNAALDEVARLNATRQQTTPHESEHHVRLLGQALGECIVAAGITHPDVQLSGPELLMFAEDLKRHLTEQANALEKVRASVSNARWLINGIMHGENVTPSEMWQACEHLSAALLRINTSTKEPEHGPGPL